MKNRHSEFDVTNSVQVSSSQSVCDAVCDIFHSCYHLASDKHIRRAFEDFDNLFEGHFDGYQSCDTFYHDKQHTLDMTLAMVRIIDGHERQSTSHHTFGAKLTTLAVITALFHDSGYIRKNHDQKHHNGAEYTRIHVSRSAGFLRDYLKMVGLEQYADIAANMVHYTGYEVAPEDIKLPDQKFHLLGYMLGSADLIAQMSDRCYLEKCRDRLYPEFLLGGLTETQTNAGERKIIYASGLDLLQKTPEFFENDVLVRLEKIFNSVYQYAATHFGGDNHYFNALNRNINHIKNLIAAGNIESLRRLPPENPGTLEFLNEGSPVTH